MAEALPEHHPVPGDLRRPRHAARDQRGAQPRDPQRAGHPDDRRGSSLDDPDEPQAAVHEPLHRSGRQFGEGFITGDAITAADIYLTIVAETAFTNVLFVAMPAEAAANGDYLLPTVFHSVQSDESRHISNGYATLLMALSDEDNRQLLERDLRYAWWNNHRVVDAAIGTFIEYGTKDRRKDRESYAEMWRRWIYDDYYRSYLVPLEKYGLVIPHDLIEEAWNQIWNKGYVHEVAQFFATGWLANYWRMDPMTDADFEWFEYKYPGWYDRYGKWWENYNRLAVPNGHNPIVFEDVDYVYPNRCWTCMVPCLVREDMVTHTF